MVGEVARGLSLFGGASSEVRRCNCSVVDESRSSLAGLGARCVSFYQKAIFYLETFDRVRCEAAEMRCEAALVGTRTPAMHARSYLLLATLVSTAEGHGALTVPTTRRGNTGYENDPVAFDSEAWVCRHAVRNPDVPLFEIEAGQKTQITWSFSAAHVGDCAVFLSYDVTKPLDSIVKVPMQPSRSRGPPPIKAPARCHRFHCFWACRLAEQRYFKIANLPKCKDQNRLPVDIDMPDWLPGGEAILRWDWHGSALRKSKAY